MGFFFVRFVVVLDNYLPFFVEDGCEIFCGIFKRKTDEKTVWKWKENEEVKLIFLLQVKSVQTFKTLHIFMSFTKFK